MKVVALGEGRTGSPPAKFYLNWKFRGCGEKKVSDTRLATRPRVLLVLLRDGASGQEILYLLAASTLLYRLPRVRFSKQARAPNR